MEDMLLYLADLQEAIRKILLQKRRSLIEYEEALLFVSVLPDDDVNEESEDEQEASKKIVHSPDFITFTCVD